VRDFVHVDRSGAYLYVVVRIDHDPHSGSSDKIWEVDLLATGNIMECQVKLGLTEYSGK
jgi:hypothetical protein